MNPIAYLISQGFKVTSDPARYKRYMGIKELHSKRL